MTKRTKIMMLIIAAVSVCLLPLMVKLQTKLVYNPSPSAPIGFYWVEADGTLKRGAYTVVPTPHGFRVMAAQRHYLPMNVPLIKRVVALVGDEICRHGQEIYVNGEPVVTALKLDSQGRTLPVWQGCLILKKDQFFALMDAPDSFDGRYFGPLNIEDVIGIATPLFTTEPVPYQEGFKEQNLEDGRGEDAGERKAR